jgi:hypothetical protein
VTYVENIRKYYNTLVQLTRDNSLPVENLPRIIQFDARAL